MLLGEQRRSMASGCQLTGICSASTTSLLPSGSKSTYSEWV